MATRAELEAQRWGLNPGRYVGAAARDTDSVDFTERLEALSEELDALNTDPQAWLADVLGWIAEHPIQKLDELLPWKWRPIELSQGVAT